MLDEVEPKVPSSRSCSITVVPSGPYRTRTESKLPFAENDVMTAAYTRSPATPVNE